MEPSVPSPENSCITHLSRLQGCLLEMTFNTIIMLCGFAGAQSAQILGFISTVLFVSGGNKAF